MNIKNSKKIVPATVFAAIIVLLAFAVMSTTVSANNGLTKTLDSYTGDLGDVVHVTISGEVGIGLTVTVVDTLPSELTYIGSFMVDGVSATPTDVDKQVISYTIDNTAGTVSKPYTIEFDVKVTEASWKNEIVTNTVDVVDASGDVVETATAVFTILPFEELWKEVREPLEIPVNTETQWALVISVTNPFDYTMKNTVITDRFGAEIEVDEILVHSVYDDAMSFVRLTLAPGIILKGNSDKVFLTWTVGDLLPGETARLKLLVSTDRNPAGKQEYSSPSPLDEPYEMNSGATLKFNDPDQDMMQLSAVTDSIYVTVLEKPVNKIVSRKYVKAGDEVLYTIRVSNTDDNSVLKMMEVRETMQMMTYVEESCSLLGTTAAKETVMKSKGMTSWKVEDGSRILEIAPGASTEFTLKATIDKDAEIGQILRNGIEVIVKI
jgi:hypothetical protein